VSVDRGSLSQYARLFVSSILPNNLSRVLYLDCDTIINKSIKELWNIELGGKTIAAMMDAFSKHYRPNIGLQKNDIMFNSGVMLIDLNKWKQKKIEKQLLNFIAEKQGKVQQGDQGALNAILSKDTFCLEPKFNSVTIFYDFSYREMLIYRKPVNFYSEKVISEAIEDPAIIHFTTSFLSLRPWVMNCTHKYVDVWLKYKALSPWKDKPLWSDTRSRWFKFLVRLYTLLPSSLAIRIAGILQAYGRPFFYRSLN